MTVDNKLKQIENALRKVRDAHRWYIGGGDNPFHVIGVSFNGDELQAIEAALEIAADTMMKSKVTGAATP